ncbi:MAG: ATP-binding protein [Candidatus Hermodarchaeota archaeon]
MISIASGKGGTGKTTIAVNLALYLSKIQQIALFDLDVEEPNVNHFLHYSMTHFEDVNILRPEVNESLCTFCGLCAELCEFKALAVLPQQVMIFSELCHGCGLCKIACPANAISEIPHKLGIIEKAKNSSSIESTNINENLTFYEGTLRVGEAMAAPIIREMKKVAFTKNYDHIILDLPPGSACPVIEALSDTDYAVLVTEPTPAGEHDLKIAIEVVKQLNIPFGIVNNRSDIGDDRISQLARKEGYKLLLEVPHDNEILNLYSQGIPLIGSGKNFDLIFEKLWEQIQEIEK